MQFPRSVCIHRPTKLVACLAGAALFTIATPATWAGELAAPFAASRIVVDSVTGRPRMPSHEEFAAAREAATAAAPAAAQRAAAAGARAAAPAFSSHPVVQRLQGQPLPAKFGATGRRVGVETLSFSVVRLGADGRIQTLCVAGEDAATHALHAPAQEASDAQ